MTISRISNGMAMTNTISLGTHAANDLILGWGMRRNVTPPTLAAGWNSLFLPTGGLGSSFQLAYKRAASGAETFGTWTSCNAVGYAVYRSSAGLCICGNAITAGAGTSLSVTYSSAYIRESSWLHIALIYLNLLTDSEAAHNGLTQLDTNNDGTAEYTQWDSNGVLSPNSPLSNVTLTGTAANWRYLATEISEVSLSGGSTGKGGRIRQGSRL